ncbi:hypothetical protein H5410_047510 [Solanum commersonii]|uniref:Uncharacterized protein n=1 Tax=Solanum commersonii TaxID=4109 RepID=A0A9J5XIH0_SOLCO|nr:hypothetical protein H5410_047510 [Solanum commersonii]
MQIDLKCLFCRKHDETKEHISYNARTLLGCLGFQNDAFRDCICHLNGAKLVNFLEVKQRLEDNYKGDCIYHMLEHL